MKFSHMFDILKMHYCAKNELYELYTFMGCGRTVKPKYKLKMVKNAQYQLMRTRDIETI